MSHQSCGIIIFILQGKEQVPGDLVTIPGSVTWPFSGEVGRESSLSELWFIASFFFSWLFPISLESLSGALKVAHKGKNRDYTNKPSA